ncbi:MAG: hypothetical protein ACE5H5_04450, partial [Nitrospinota bacterium]
MGLLRRLTVGCFHSAGVGDEELACYVAGVLVDFARIEQLFKLTSADGHRLEYLFEMVGAAEASGEMSRHRAYKHLGDYALFMTGLFPEYLERARRYTSPLYYIERGKASYGRLARLDPLESYAPLFRKLADRFEACVAGLQLEQLYLRDPFYQTLLRQLG